MASYKTAFGSFLKTEDLQGRQVQAVIESVELEEIKGDHGMERKLVAHFAGKEKGLILNLTNCELIEQIAGTDDVEKWSGTRVVLYPTTTKFGGKTVPCLRIKTAGNGAVPRPVAVTPPPPLPPTPEPEPEYVMTEDDIPF